MCLSWGVFVIAARFGSFCAGDEDARAPPCAGWEFVWSSLVCSYGE